MKGHMAAAVERANASPPARAYARAPIQNEISTLVFTMAYGAALAEREELGSNFLHVVQGIQAGPVPEKLAWRPEVPGQTRRQLYLSAPGLPRGMPASPTGLPSAPQRRPLSTASASLAPG